MPSGTAALEGPEGSLTDAATPTPAPFDQSQEAFAAAGPQPLYRPSAAWVRLGVAARDFSASAGGGYCSLEFVPGESPWPGPGVLTVWVRLAADGRTFAAHALSGACSHAAAAMLDGAAGEVEDLAGIPGLAAVACPVHCFVFSLQSGECLTNPSPRMRCHPVREARSVGELEVRVAALSEQEAPREQLPMSTCDAIQMRLVEIGLDRRYGPDHLDDDDDVFGPSAPVGFGPGGPASEEVDRAGPGPPNSVERVGGVYFLARALCASLAAGGTALRICCYAGLGLAVLASRRAALASRSASSVAGDDTRRRAAGTPWSMAFAGGSFDCPPRCRVL